jgi:hypothetical protein
MLALLLLVLACTVNINQKDSETDISVDSNVEVTPLEFIWDGSFYTNGRNNQLYDLTVDPATGMFYLSNPLYYNQTGAIYNFSGPVVGVLEDEVPYITGSEPGATLGVQVDILSDGASSYLVSSEFGVNMEGRFLAIPTPYAGFVPMEASATLSLSGEESGDFPGTGAAVLAGQLYVSATTAPKLYTREHSFWDGFLDGSLRTSGSGCHGLLLHGNGFKWGGHGSGILWWQASACGCGWVL